MTDQEKLDMYREKKKFIENLNEVFSIEPGCAAVAGVHDEVYTKDYGEGRIDTREWIIVHYTGGGRAPRITSGNSNAANFAVIGSMLQGGCYEQVRLYEEQFETGYQRIEV